ncbi:hypothetical protein SBOR_8104 [Sclerotinia borealis F-4128]|uniref:Uncharacterized protein n=1 Tax=Sclerotinia borealis (strain F-4128) TaxID=1432307 RepID=W9C6M0_SCLBF|nr:hypothetical protein SBOR_8104 [Sclerotinia borealis F-4128]
MPEHDGLMRIFWPLDISRTNSPGVIIGWRNSGLDVFVVAILEDIDARNVEDALKAGTLFRSTSYPIERIYDLCGQSSLHILGLANSPSLEIDHLQIHATTKLGLKVPQISCPQASTIQIIMFKRPLPSRMQYISLGLISLALGDKIEKTIHAPGSVDEEEEIEEMKNRKTTKDLIEKLKFHIIIKHPPSQKEKEKALPWIVNQINCAFEVHELLQKNISFVRTRSRRTLSVSERVVESATSMLRRTFIIGLVCHRVVAEVLLLMLEWRAKPDYAALKDVSATAQQVEIRLQQFCYIPVQPIDTLPIIALRSHCFLSEVVSGDSNFTLEKLVAEATDIMQRHVKISAVRASTWCQNRLASNADAYRTGKAVVMVSLRSEGRGNAITMTVKTWATAWANKKYFCKTYDLACRTDHNFKVHRKGRLGSIDHTVNIKPAHTRALKTKNHYYKLCDLACRTIYRLGNHNKKMSYFRKMTGTEYVTLRKKKCDWQSVTDSHLDYIRFYNSLWLVLNDVIIGFALGSYIIDNSAWVAECINQTLDLYTITALSNIIVWLKDWLAGLKLNNELAAFLGGLFLWVIDHWSSGIRFELRDIQQLPSSSTHSHNPPPTSYIYLKSVPLPFRTIFHQYFQLGHRIRKHYLSPRVLLCFLTGKFVPPIHRKNLYSLQYSMLPARRAGILEMWHALTATAVPAKNVPYFPLKNWKIDGNGRRHYAH